MGVERTKEKLLAAEHNYRGCHAHVHRTSAAWLDAEAAASSNRRHYRLRRTHGDNYRQELKDAHQAALREFDEATVRLEKAKREHEEALGCVGEDVG